MSLSGYKLGRFTGDPVDLTMTEQYFDQLIYEAQQMDMKLAGKCLQRSLPKGTSELIIPISEKIDGTSGKTDTTSSGLVTAVMGTDYTELRPVTGGTAGDRYAFTQNEALQTKARRLQSTAYDYYPLIPRNDTYSQWVDVLQMVTTEAKYRWNRYRDKVIITALGAQLDEGTRNTSTGAWSWTSTTALPTGQIVNSAKTDTISRGMIEDIIYLFDLNDVSIDGPERPVLLIGPKQKQQLREEDILVDFDYQTYKPLSGSGLPTCLGFDVIVSNLLDSSDNVRTCYAFLPSAIVFAEWEDMHIQIDNRPDRRNATQIAFDHESGAIRIDDYKIVQFYANEMVAP